MNSICLVLRSFMKWTAVCNEAVFAKEKATVGGDHASESLSFQVVRL